MHCKALYSQNVRAWGCGRTKTKLQAQWCGHHDGGLRAALAADKTYSCPALACVVYVGMIIATHTAATDMVQDALSGHRRGSVCAQEVRSWRAHAGKHVQLQSRTDRKKNHSMVKARAHPRGPGAGVRDSVMHTSSHPGAEESSGNDEQWGASSATGCGTASYPRLFAY